MIINTQFLKKAEAERPKLHVRTVTRSGEGALKARGDRMLFDFGEHLTGRIRLSFGYEGHHPDAPVWLRLRFAERANELTERVEDYRGWISAAWVQQEDLHVDEIPGELRLPRRYAFRFVQVEVLDISSRFALTIPEVSCDAFTSADEKALQPLACGDEELAAIDRIACKTLKECMQEVFEDGPKRDRRLWLGDLRLQALTNHVTYRNEALVRRCLYLFAGSVPEEGGLAASIFTAPEVEADDQYMFDYALLFAKTLEDYVRATEDRETLSDLWPTVKRQFACAERFFAEDGSVREPEIPHWCFVDWNLELHKDLCAAGIWLYCAEAAGHLAEWMGDEAFGRQLRRMREVRRAAAERCFDAEAGLYVSGPDRQISWSSQVWAVLGGLTEDAGIFFRAEQAGALKMVSPYMYHYYVEALCKLGRRDEALAVIRRYWGGMAKQGADTFWELYDPEDPDGSPYGGTIVNSYCHAWSCTPAYFLRTVFCE